MPTSTIVRRSASRICCALSTRTQAEGIACARLAQVSEGAHPMNATVSVNGRISDAASAVVPVFDHGFLYGEGVYETLRTYHRVPFLYERHARRLRQSAALMALPVPQTDAELLAAMRETMAAHAGLEEAYIRILADARRRRAHLQPGGVSGAVGRDHRQAVSRAARAHVHERHSRLARERPAQPSAGAQPDDQVEQPAQQRARDAGGAQARRRRGADAEPGGRSGRVLAVELLHRPRRPGADAAARRRPAARHHARVRDGARR